MIKIVALDTEYNSRREILSLGLFNNYIAEDYYFNNKVDSITKSIHGLEYSFLKKFDSYKSEKYLTNILSYDYLVGFDIYSDLEVLKISKIESLYSKFKIIDIKFIYSYLGLNLSLEKLSSLIKFNGIIHTSLGDSQITFKLMLFLYKSCQDKFSYEVFLSKLAQLTYHSFLGCQWEKDLIESEFSFLINKFNVIDLKNVIPEKEDIILFNNDIYIFNGKKCIFRFPFEYLNKGIVYIEKEVDSFGLGYKFNEKFIDISK